MVALLLTLSMSALAQVTTSSMTGKVTLEGSGDEIIGATVVAVHEPSGTRYNAVTNVNGLFTIQGMRPGGPYNVTVSYIGHQTKTFRGITLQLAETYNLPVWLSENVTDLAEIVVTGTASKFSQEKTGAATNITSAQITALPTVNRSITDVTRLSPYGGNGGTISVYPKTANTGSSARTFSFDVVHSDDNSVKQTVTCTQAANAVTISTILADATVTSSNTVNYEVDGVTVMAAQGGKNYVIGDATGVMLMYVNQTLTVGKQYKVSGGVKLYNGVHEFTGTLNITESTGTAPAAGTPETMTVSSLTAYAAAPVTKYAVVTATAQSSG